MIGFITNGRTITVGKNQPVKSVKRALELAKIGDTIKVLSGIYREGSILIQKSVTLIGIDYPVIDGQNQFENLIISGSKIEVKGFRFIDSKHSSSNDYAAIKIIDCSEVRILYNRIFNAHFGIHLANTTQCLIQGNKIEGKAISEQSAGNGIHIWKSNHARIIDNQIQGHRDGIYFEFVTESEIHNNISEKNIRYGLHFMFSHNDIYIGNTFQNNGTGVAVMYSKNVRMERNVFQNNWGTASYAILIKEITDSYIIKNLFISNTIGLFIEGGNRMQVKKNLFKENGWALKIQANCSDNDIAENNFTGNTFDVTTNGTLVLSRFDNNYWDKYEGYDMNKDGIGDVPYHPVSIYSMIIDQNPSAVVLLRSFMVNILDKAEKAIPSLTPENLVDKTPSMKPFKL